MGVLHRAVLVVRPNTPPSNRTACPTSEGPKKAVDARRPLAKVAPPSVAVANFMAALTCVIASSGEVSAEGTRDAALLREGADVLMRYVCCADHDHEEFVLHRRPACMRDGGL